MLCGEAPRSIIEQLQQRISSDLEHLMSILLTDTRSMPPAPATDPAAPLHQSSSGTSAAFRRPAWWRWLDRPMQRIALREIADDPHLLNDLGLYDESVTHLQRALQLDPQSVVALNSAGLALQHLDRADEAVQHLRRALELAPDYFPVSSPP